MGCSTDRRTLMRRVCRLKAMLTLQIEYKYSVLRRSRLLSPQWLPRSAAQRL